MTDAELMEIINKKLEEPQGKYNGGFEMDKTIKDIILNQIKEYCTDNNKTFILDEDNNNNPFADIDMIFSIDGEPYAIELKTRPNSTIDDYPDVMFNPDKMEKLINLAKQGYKPYFINVWKDYYFHIYDILRIKESEIRKDFSYQTKTTQFNKYEQKDYIEKIYLPKFSSSVVASGYLQ